MAGRLLAREHQYYRFCRLLNLHVSGDDSRLLTFFSKELAFHRVTDEPHPSSPTVNLHTSKESLRSATRLQPFSRRLVARWRYQLDTYDNKIDIVAHGNRLSIPLIFHMLVVPALRYLAAHNDHLMLHAGVVSENARSLIFTGPGGSGKTTLTSLLLMHGANARGLQGDDYIFIDPRAGFTFPFITRSHLYGNLLRWVPSLRSRLTRTERVRATLLQWARTWSRDALRWPVRLPINRIWGYRVIDECSQPQSLILVQRTDIDTAPQLTAVPNRSHVAQALLDMNFQEAERFVGLLTRSLGAPAAKGLVTEWRSLERELLEVLIRNQEVRYFCMPTSAPSDNQVLHTLEMLEQLLTK